MRQAHERDRHPAVGLGPRRVAAADALVARRRRASAWSRRCLDPTPATGRAPRRLDGHDVDIAIVRSKSREAGLAASERASRSAARRGSADDLARRAPLARLNAAPPGARGRASVPSSRRCSPSVRLVAAHRAAPSIRPSLPLVRAWDLRGAGRIPTPAELAAAVAATGPGRFRLDPGSATRRAARPRGRHRRGGLGQGLRARPGRRAAARRRRPRRAARSGRPGPGPRPRRRRSKPGRSRSPIRASAGDPSSMLALAEPARPRPPATPSAAASRRRPPDRPRARPAHRRAGAGLRLGHRRRALGARRRRPLDRLLRARAREGARALRELRREGVAQEVLFLVDRRRRRGSRPLASPGLSPDLVLSADPARRAPGLTTSTP